MKQKNIGQKIREARTDAGVSQKELSRRLGHSKPGAAYISKLEAGKISPLASTLSRIAAALKINIQTLL